jgi:hypothetical protein
MQLESEGKAPEAGEDMEPQQDTASLTEWAESARSSADRENRPSRPLGLWILTLILLASPMIHAGALLPARDGSLGSPRLWDALCISSSRLSWAC